jgi:hypothetical protein
MPASTKHTLLTWIPDSADGEREVRKLHARYAGYSTLVNSAQVTAADLDKHSLFVVVGHRSEITQTNTFHSLAELVRQSTCQWVVLANCSTGVATRQETLGDNELSSPGQILANRLRIRVSGTSRPLTFDEVGMGLAFTLVHGEFLIRANPPDGSKLWIDFEPQDAVMEIDEAIRNL